MTATIRTALLTGADTALSRAVLESLPDSLHLRAVDTRFTAPLPRNLQGVEGDLRDPAFMTQQLEGVDTVLHFAPIASLPESDSEAIDIATRGTYVLMTTALAAGVKRVILGSTLSLFDSLPANWKVSERWRPRPTPELTQLVPWLAELSVRESARATEMRAICLRFGRLTDEPDSRRVEAVVAGIQRTLEITEGDRGWSIRHIGTPNAPEHENSESASPAQNWKQFLAPPSPIPARKIHNVVCFGAGGPVGAAVAEEMASSYTLRLTDLRALEDIFAEGKPQSKYAPLPRPFPPPHEDRVVDVGNAEQVMAACEGMDAIINCSVLRDDPVKAFLVNTLGAYHIARAAVQHTIRRIVQTGPALTLVDDPPDYTWDYDQSADAPPRPYRHLYFHSKYLGQEILRVFADYYGLEVPVLLYCHFVNPEILKQGEWVHPLAISWRDSARSIRRAVETQALEHRYEVFQIGADMPHGVYDNTKARLMLGWEPQDDLERAWQLSEPHPR